MSRRIDHVQGGTVVFCHEPAGDAVLVLYWCCIPSPNCWTELFGVPMRPGMPLVFIKMVSERDGSLLLRVLFDRLITYVLPLRAASAMGSATHLLIECLAPSAYTAP